MKNYTHYTYNQKTNNMPTYILQKDLPDSKTGDEYIWVDYYQRYYKNADIEDSYWTKESVENNPEWFKLKEEKIKVINIETDGFYAKEPKEFLLRIVTNKIVGREKMPSIKEAIERVLNNKEDEKKYSIQDMEKCWLASRLQLNTKGLGDVAFTFKGFIDKNYVEDYK